jgi:hypothetical protein
MKWGSSCYVLVFSALLFVGCGESETAQEIRKERKAGNLERAYDIAVASLSASSDQMDVWCEFVYTNLELARRSDPDQDPFKYLAQSALMCVALDKFRGGLPEKWKAAAKMTRGLVVTQSRKVLDRIDTSHKGNEAFQEPELESNISNSFIESQRERMKREYEMRFLKNNTNTLVDPVFARTTVWQEGCYYEILNLLPMADSTTSKIAMRIIDEQLDAWPTFSELDPSFITDVREEARIDLMGVYSTLFADLKDSDHFSAEHVLNMELHP